jgi:hypothetical protein
LVQEARVLDEEIAEMRERAEYYACSVLSHAPKGRGRGNAVEDYLAAKERLESRILENLLGTVRKRLQIEKMFAGIEDDEARCIARMRFTKGRGWEEIGERLYMDARTARRKLQRAMEGNKLGGL